MSSSDAAADLDDAVWMATRTRSANAGAAVTTALAYLGQALSLVTVPLYLKYLGQEQYGVMLLLVTLQTYLGQANLGLNWAAMNMIGAARATGDTCEFATVVQNALVLGVVTAGVALGASAAIAAATQYGLATLLQLDASVDPGAILAVGGLAALSLAGGPVYLTFVGMGRSSTAATYQGLGRVWAIPVMAAVAWRGGGIAEMFLANGAILAVLLAIAAWQMWSSFPHLAKHGLRLSGDQCRRQLAMGLKNMSAELGFLLHATAPTVALGATCGATAVPLYAVPKSLLDAALTFGRSQFSVLQPAYAEAARQGRTDAIARLLSQSLSRNVTLLGLLCAGFIVLAGPFVELWTSGRLAVDRPAAAAIALGAAAMFLVQLFQLFLIATDRQLTATRILGVSGACTLGAIAVAGWWGGFAAAIGMAAGAGWGTVLLLGGAVVRCAKFPFAVRAGVERLAVELGMACATVGLGLAVFWLVAPTWSPAAAIVFTGGVMAAAYAVAVRFFHRTRALKSDAAE